MLLAEEYARYYNIPPRRHDESEMEFRERVSGVLRGMGKIIEAHEAYQNERYETSDSVMTAIIGAVQLEASHQCKAPDPMRQVGDDVAAGIARKRQEVNPELLLLAILLGRAEQ